MTNIWALPEERVHEALGTSPKGLSEDDAFARLKEHGKNVLPTKVGRPIVFKFLDQFTSLFAIMLEVAAVLVFIAAMLSTGASREDNINAPQRDHRVLPGVPRREGHGGTAKAGAGQRKGRP
jgi:magnesium-transporting ATPase (P-type)